MSSHTDPLSAQERRSYPRVPLDTPFFVTLKREKAHEELSAVLVDCSQGGVQLALPPSSEPLFDWLGLRVLILGLPSPMDPPRLGCSGSVSWVSEERCGIRFSQPLALSDEALIALTETL